jgi:hypothetical protein
MNTNRKTARIVGALFLTAMVTSILGGFWLESILNAPDYLISVSANETQVITGVLLELINGLAVVGIAVATFPTDLLKLLGTTNSTTTRITTG